MPENTLPDVYELGTSKYGKPLIIIRRKPSQIPLHIERVLLPMAGTGYMDGPNNYVHWEFLLPEKLVQGEAYLKQYGWVKV